MIYLFEDRPGRIPEGVDMSKVTRLAFDCQLEQIDDFICGRMSDVSVVLFHQSYVFPDSRIKLPVVEKKFLELGYPFIRFSGGEHSNGLLLHGSVYTAVMNSADMYRNLNLFSEYLVEHGEANIPLLVYGGDGYLINSKLQFQKQMSDIVWDLNSDDTVSGRAWNLIRVCVTNNLQEMEFKEKKEDLLSRMAEMRSEGTLTGGRVRQLVDQFVNED